MRMAECSSAAIIAAAWVIFSFPSPARRRRADEAHGIGLGGQPGGASARPFRAWGGVR